MNLTLSEEQEMLKKSAFDFLTDKCPKKAVKEMEESEEGYSPTLWQSMAELGWMGLAFPEKYGGGGMSFLDLSILLEEIGRACLPGPFFSTVIMGAFPILEMGSEEQKQMYLPEIAAGKAIFTLALDEPGYQSYDINSITAEARFDNDAYVISGTKLFVPYAQIADYLLCVARTKPENKIAVFLVDAKAPKISHTVLETVANDKLCEVVFDGVRVSKNNILGQAEQDWSEIQKIIERAALAKCCEVVGSIQKVLEMTIDYAKERKQFERPIGSFQIIQHYCADMATDADGAELATYQAAWMLSQHLPCSKEIAVAKAWTGEASQRITNLAHQIHGAIGATMEHDLPFYTRRAKAAELSFGGANFYREIVAKEMGLVN